jgi:hypothetical protein
MFTLGDVFENNALGDVINFMNIKDFADAIQNGCIAAYGMYVARKRGEAVPPLNYDNPDKVLLKHYQTLGAPMAKHMKGCLFHFQQSSRRIVSRHAIVPVVRQKEWWELTTILLETNEKLVYEKALSDISNNFPKARSWLAWWKLPSHACQIFPAMWEIEERFLPTLPTTNNRVESKNRDMNRTSGIICLPIDNTPKARMPHRYY